MQASVQGTRDSRQAVAGSDEIMLVSGVPARARRIRRRFAVRWCRHKLPVNRAPAACEMTDPA